MLTPLFNAFSAVFCPCSRAAKGCSRARKELPTAAQVSEVAITAIKAGAVGAAVGGTIYAACSHFDSYFTPDQHESIAYNMGITAGCNAYKLFQKAQLNVCNQASISSFVRDLRASNAASRKAEIAEIKSDIKATGRDVIKSNNDKTPDVICSLIESAIQEEMRLVYDRMLVRRAKVSLESPLASADELRAAITAAKEELYAEVRAQVS
jgi:hypothetical protein